MAACAAISAARSPAPPRPGRSRPRRRRPRPTSRSRSVALALLAIAATGGTAPRGPEFAVPATSTGAAPDPGRARARPRSWQHDGAAARSRANTYPAAVLALSRPELDDGHRGRAQPTQSWTPSPRPRVGPARSRRPPHRRRRSTASSLASRSAVASRLFSRCVHSASTSIPKQGQPHRRRQRRPRRMRPFRIDEHPEALVEGQAHDLGLAVLLALEAATRAKAVLGMPVNGLLDRAGGIGCARLRRRRAARASAGWLRPWPSSGSRTRHGVSGRRIASAAWRGSFKTRAHARGWSVRTNVRRGRTAARRLPTP
jgi:hypothetical protein